MGIRGLTSYVNTLPSGEGKVWEHFDLRDTNLVIDCCGFNFYIYACNKLNCKFGGQYDELKKEVKEFFSKLRLNNVVPYVVIDGIKNKNEKKSVTCMERKKKKIAAIKNLWTSSGTSTFVNPGYKVVLPRLAQLTIVQVLQEMKMPYAEADFEADCEIASLANELNAPVLSNDSDFCIFHIKHGYIPFENYDFSGPKTTVKKFSFDAFAKHLRINPNMLPLLASLAGNDYISDEMLEPFHRDAGIDSSNKFQNILQFFSSHNSDSEAIDAVIDLFPNDRKASFKNALDSSIEEYQMKRSNLIDYFDPAFSGDHRCNMLTYNGHSLPQCVVQLYRQGLIASEGLDCLCNRKIFLGIQSEDTALPSAQICAQGLRWYYYKLVLNCEGTSNTDSTSQATTEDIVVTESDREKSECVENEVNLTREIPKIHDILRMSDEDRNSHILGLLDSDLPSIHDLPPEHQLVAATMRYWVIHSQIKPAHLAALLVYYVGENWSLTAEESFEISVEAVHGFAQWQNVLYWAERLNTLFSCTFPQLQVAKLYDGVRVCKVYEKLRVSGITFAETIVTNENVYRHLYDVITEELPRDWQFKHSRSRGRHRNKKNRRLEQEKETKNKNSELLKGNRFELLCLSDLDEDLGSG